MKIIFFIGASLLTFAVFGQSQIELPSEEHRKLLFEQVVDNLNRVDGDGLLPFANRPETWKQTTDKLKLEAIQSKNLFQLGRVFKRLDAAYPNLHAKVYLQKNLDQNKSEGRVKFPFKIQPDLVSSESTSYRFFIQVDEKNIKKTELKNSDELLEINGINLSKFQENAFIFCKFPFKSQCALELSDNLRQELLGWSRDQELIFTVKRKSERLNIKVIPEIVSWDTPPDMEAPNDCESQSRRYKGFSLEYSGQNLCVYESKTMPTKIVMRIKSFSYFPDGPINYLDAEVDLFYANYWKKKSRMVKTIIFDIIENYGGDSPVPYYAIFTQNPFQEMYAQFKKIKEFEEKDIKESFFWGSKAKEIWLENIKTQGIFEKTKEGEFLPPVAQFCAERNKNCNEGLFKPKKHKFNGNIKIMVNQWCISSCVGFISNMTRLFKGRVQTYGHYDSGDSTYSRVTVASSVIDGKVKTSLLPMKKARNPEQPEPWVRQIVSVTRSTNESGVILSGKPQKIDHWIPRKWNQTDEQWVQDVFSKALKN